MKKEKFRVSYTKTNLIIAVLAILLLAAIGIWAIVCEKKIAAGVIVLVTALIIAIVMTPGMLFYIEVSGEDFKVHNGFGKIVRFHLADIKRIECEKSGSVNVGYHRYVRIRIAQDSFITSHMMHGFIDLCTYLLACHSSGELTGKRLNSETAQMLEEFLEPPKRTRGRR